MSENSGRLSKRALYYFFRAIYWSIWTLSVCDENNYSEEGGSSVQQESLFMDSTVLALCDNILGDDLQGCKTVSFHDLARWYATVGFRGAPWLELLDLSKWIYLAS
jgi:hypothetical protein